MLILPFFYAAIGFVSGVMAAAVYNWLARRVGGIKMRLHTPDLPGLDTESFTVVEDLSSRPRSNKMIRLMLMLVLAAVFVSAGCGGRSADIVDGGMLPNDDGSVAVTGACCSIDTTCAQSDSNACATQGGTFTERSTCGAVTCPGPSMTDYRLLTRRLESTLANDIEWYIEAVSIVGREYWNQNDDDLASTNELLGRQALDPAGDFTVRPFATSYEMIREADRFVQATENAAFPVTEELLRGVMGLAKTLQAYSLLLVANHQFSNGILPLEALEEADPSGSFLNYEESLQYIADLLGRGRHAPFQRGCELCVSVHPGV